MPQKKRSTAKKRTTSQKRKSRRTNKKVYIPLNNLLSLCAIIIGICTALLLANTFSSGQKNKIPPQTAAVEKQEHKQNQNKNEETANPKRAQETSEKKEQSKDSLKTTAVQKPSENREKSIPNKTENKNTVSKSVSKTTETEEKQNSAWDIPNFPQAKNNAKLVFIFDDGGHNMQQLEKCVTLPFPVTVAVLPRLAYSAKAAERVRKSGNEVILHQPMQSVNLSTNPGAGAITPDMDEEAIRSTVLANIYEIWPISGMNNHEGSLITTDAEKIATVMQICSQEGIYFLDSRTNSESKVRYVSGVMGYPYYERNIFLDNTKVRKDILSEIEKGVAIANKNGVAIMIGHVWSAEILPGILREVYPVLNAKGYTFTTVSNSGALKRG